MKLCQAWLREEMLKPIRALKGTVILLIKLTILAILRTFLWWIFFLLPLIAASAFGFHALTGKARSMKAERSYHAQASTQNSTQAAESSAALSAFNLKTLSYDLRFWKHELERLMK